MHVYGELTGNLSAEQTLNGSLSSIINRGVDVVSVDITTNGTYTAPSGMAYSPVTVNVRQPSGTKQISITQNGTTTEDVEWYEDAELSVNVPNTYAQADEGKVVNNGALVGQTSTTKTQNGTYDTTLNDEVVVNVPYSCIGKNPTLLRTELKPKVYLKDTGYATWTPSTTATTIVPTTNEFTFEADMLNYDYMLCQQFYTHLYYDDEAQQKSRYIEGSGESWTAVYRYPSGNAQLFDRNWNTNGAAQTIQAVNSTHYYAANGNETVVSTSYGIYFVTQMPSVSNTTTSNPTWTVKSPTIQARCNDQYLTVYNAGHVNQNTSYYQLKYTLYRVDYGTCPFRFTQDRKNDILINHGLE